MARNKRPGSRARRARKPERKLSLKSQMARARALDALNMMRNRRYSLALASKQALTSPRTILKYVASAVHREENGRYQAKPSDRLLRQVHFHTPDGPIVLDVRGSRKASLLARHYSAVNLALLGQTDALAEFQGKSVVVGKVRYPFFNDLSVLKRQAYAGVFSGEGFYALTA